MTVFRRLLLCVPLLVVAVFLLTAVNSCDPGKVNPGPDRIACVYNDENHGRRLVKEVQPGEHFEYTKNYETVYIPTSNRFFMASEDDNRDTLAPRFYEGTAARGVRIHVQGQVRFRFNRARACEWYAKHGRRNAPLDFNARGRVDQAKAGWLRFLAENFGVTMRDVVSSETNRFAWPGLTYNYPEGSDPDTGLVSAGRGGDPLRKVYGRRLGVEFTKELNANLGGEYFCGIDEATPGDECPPMTFQVVDVAPVDPQLTRDREAAEKLRQQAENAAQTAKVRAATQQALIEDEHRKQELAREQKKTNAIEAEATETVAKCLALAKVKLDCDGHFQTVIVPGAR